FFSYLPFDPHLIESFCHTTEPSFRPLGSDGEGQVASPHPRGTVFPGIKGRASKKLGQEKSLFFHDRPDIIGKDRGQQGVPLYSGIKSFHNSADRWIPADS